MQNTGAILCVRGGKKQKYGAGSGLAPRAVVLIWVFCQNTRNRPLCSYTSFFALTVPCPTLSYVPLINCDKYIFCAIFSEIFLIICLNIFSVQYEFYIMLKWYENIIIVFSSNITLL